MGLDVGLSEVDRIEVVFEEVNNEDITVELVDNPVTIELETPPEIQVAINEIYSDVNVILDHNKQINRNLNKQHTAETIQESTSKRFTSDTEISNLEPKKGVNEFYITGEEKFIGALLTGNTTLTTLNQVADKAQFAPNENGTILYHVAKWFTPTGTISTNGTTATSTSTQFTGAMVGAKLIIMGEERIITAFTSSTIVVVNSAYSQNYLGVIAGNWGAYSIAYKYSLSNHLFYDFSGGLLANILAGSVLQMNYFRVFFAQFGFSGLELSSNYKIRWSNTQDSGYATTKDVGLGRSGVGTLEINDGITAGSYRDLNVRNINYYGALTNASDERLKHDIKTVNNALDKCCAIAECVRHFEFNDQNIYAKGQRTGFIAQLLRDNGFEGHISEREPNNEEEGTIFGWSYKDDNYEEENPETNEIEVKTRRIVDVKGDMVLQIENNFSPYVYPALAELRKENELLKERLILIEVKLGIQARKDCGIE